MEDGENSKTISLVLNRLGPLLTVVLDWLGHDPCRPERTLPQIRIGLSSGAPAKLELASTSCLGLGRSISLGPYQSYCGVIARALTATELPNSKPNALICPTDDKDARRLGIALTTVG
jgi:hypothetical protein